MARITAFECDVCLKIAKASVCSCCGGDAIPSGWICVKAAATPDEAPSDPPKEGDGPDETWLTACTNALCQEVIKGQEAPAENVPDAPAQTEPGLVN